MAAYQVHGNPRLPLGWMGLGGGVQHSVTHNSAHPLDPAQGGDDGGGWALAHGHLPQHDDYMLQQAMPSASRTPGGP